MSEVVARAHALAQVLRDQPADLAPDSLAQAVLASVQGLLRIGEFSLARGLAEEASRRSGPLEPVWRLRLGIAFASTLRYCGDYRAAHAATTALSETFQELLQAHPSERVLLTNEHGASLRFLNRTEEAIALLAQLRASLMLQGDSLQLVQCTYQLATAAFFGGHVDLAKRNTLDALVTARRVGDAYFEALCLDHLGRIERLHCRWQGSVEVTSQGLEIAKREGMRLQISIFDRCIGIAQWKRGRLQEALARAERTALSAAELGQPVHEWMSRLLAGMVLLHAGKLDEAQRTFTTTARWQDVSADSRGTLLTAEFLGDVHLEQGQAAKALELYDSVLPKALALVPKGDIVAELRRRRAECYYLLGEFDRAYEEALTGLKHCRELGDRYEEAATYRPLALAAAAIGRTAEAKSWFDHGFAYYEDIETPYEWGKLWLAYGDWLNGPHAGRYADAGAALEAYRAAREHFERMGAEAKLAMAQERIAALAPIAAPVTSAATSDIASEIRDKIRAPRRPRASSELERRGAWAFETFGIVTRHRAVLDMLEQCAKLAAGRAPILVLGESGTGKELIAAGIHKISGRPGHYMPLNCASIPKEVFESELFGHMAGAFTGATRDKVGIVEACDGGTMFLDEVGEMPVELQARVLRFLESGEFRRVGATKNTRADTRLVAATNRDRTALKSGEGFRADLYYRLAHGVLTLPPLRHRGDDIVLLIEHFLEQACTEAGKRIALAESAWARLGAHPWPGNVRELRATIHRLVALAHDGDTIDAERIELDDSDVPTNLLEETIVVEKRRIEEALRQAGGMKSAAARILGLSRTTLLSKMKRYGMME